MLLLSFDHCQAVMEMFAQQSPGSMNVRYKLEKDRSFQVP